MRARRRALLDARDSARPLCEGRLEAGSRRFSVDERRQTDAELQITFARVELLKPSERSLTCSLRHRASRLEALLRAHGAIQLDLPPLRPRSRVGLLQTGFAVVHVRMIPPGSRDLSTHRPVVPLLSAQDFDVVRALGWTGDDEKATREIERLSARQSRHRIDA